MIALLVVLAGFCVMFGARSAAKRLLVVAFVLIVAVELLAVALSEFSAYAPRIGRTLDSSLLLVGTSLTVSAIGYAAWRTRAARASRRQEERRKSGTPRERAGRSTTNSLPDEEGFDA